MKTIAITMGDPAGIGAEVIVKALAQLALPKVRVVVIGDRRFLCQALKVTGVNLQLQMLASLDQDVACAAGFLQVLDLGNADPKVIPLGTVSAAAGKAAYEYVETAVSLALQKKVEAIVTAPLNKAALNAGGYRFNGHTEILAYLTGVKDYAMMLVAEGLKVVHITTHVALRKACELVTKERVYRVIHLADRVGKRFKLARPLIAVAGLNPHAGEGGLFGEEELFQIGPAIEMARRDGINVVGPLPPDTVFAKARSGSFDFVVAMYHDQGHIPVKMVGFDLTAGHGRTKISGINVTLGLPFVRTSVDHGTAFDLAGKGEASAQSMIDAIKLAVELT